MDKFIKTCKRIKNKINKEVLSDLKQHIKLMSNNERIEFFDSIEEGFCKECGFEYDNTSGICHCSNEE